MRRTRILGIVLSAFVAAGCAGQTGNVAPPPQSGASAFEAIQLTRRAQATYLAGSRADAEALRIDILSRPLIEVGTDAMRLVADLNDFGSVLYRYGDLQRSAEILARALDLAERNFEPGSPPIAEILFSLGNTLRSMGRLSEAEALIGRALEIRDSMYGNTMFRGGDWRGDIAPKLMAFGSLKQSIRAYDEAEKSYSRALQIVVGVRYDSLDKGQWPADLRVADWWRAESARDQIGRQRSPLAGQVLRRIGSLRIAQGRHREAVGVLHDAVRILASQWGREDIELAWALAELGQALADQLQYREAAQALERAVTIATRLFGADHIFTASMSGHLAGVYWEQGHAPRALELYRGAAAVVGNQMAVNSGPAGGAEETVRGLARPPLLALIGHLKTLARPAPPAGQDLMAEAFQHMQLLQPPGVGATVHRAALRTGLDDPLVNLIRAREEAVDRWREIDRQLLDAAPLPNERRDLPGEARKRNEKAEIEVALRTLDNRLAREFPDYAEMTNPRPVSLAATQRSLRPDEALVAYLVGETATYAWVVRRHHGAWERLEIGRQELETLVRSLRDQVDPQQLGPDRVAAILTERGRPGARGPTFDVDKAHELYRRIFAPLEAAIGEARSLLIVPDQALQSLPLGLLPTAPAKGPDGLYAPYREMAWLARKYALTTLPSVSSLQAQRRIANAPRTTRPFVGFGDPLVGQTMQPASARAFYRGLVADADRVRRSFAALPETAVELRAMAQSLGATEEALYLRDRATETQVRSSPLTPYRVVAFATHGLMAGEFSDGAEPALVLTPPPVSTVEDDGLLTASEVAQLKLDAELVILSACNTAAADGKPGAEGLSGLAKAFFYAGGRALLVSHWAVASDSTVQLTTAMLAELGRATSAGRAEALRSAAIKVMTDVAQPHFAHPLFWAPFVLVGDPQ